MAAGCGGGKGNVALEAAAPGVTRACRATAAAALATAPPSITVAGLACHPTANGRYELEPVPLNGRPHYTTTAGGAMHLYWTPHCFATGGVAWVVDELTDGSHAEAFLISPSEAPPTTKCRESRPPASPALYPQDGLETAGHSKRTSRHADCK